MSQVVRNASASKSEQGPGRDSTSISIAGLTDSRRRSHHSNTTSNSINGNSVNLDEENILKMDEYEVIKKFNDITGVTDIEYSKSILSNHNFDVQSAVLAFFSSPITNTSSTSHSSSSLSESHQMKQMEEGITHQRFSGTQPSIHDTQGSHSANATDIASSLSLSESSSHHIFHHQQQMQTSPATTSATAITGRSINNYNTVSTMLEQVAATLLRPLRLLTGAQIQTGDETTDARKFIDMFERKYNHQSRDEIHVNFLPISYRSALIQAAAEKKPLFIYLHCNDHPNTDAFCREVLSSPDVCNLINNSMIAWGGDVDFKDAYEATYSFQISAYPFVAIVNVIGTSQIHHHRYASARVIDKIEGYESVQAFLPRIRQITQQFAHASTTQSRAQREAAERARLLEEQQEELKMAMEEDSRREVEEKRKLEELKKQALEEERKRKQEEEMKQNEMQMMINTIEMKRKRLLNEPDISDKNAFTIRFQLPEGTKLSRRFPSDATMNDLRDYLDIELYDRKSCIKRFALSLSYPRRVFQPDETNCTLTEAGLTQRSALFIQDLDA